MIYKEFEKIVLDGGRSGYSDLYIRNLLKEYLQVYILNYIYTEGEYSKELIFTGGTCLRQIYGLPRLSEDLDFDYNNKGIDASKLSNDLLEYFRVKYKFNDVSLSLKQNEKQILIKFPVLKKLHLAKDNESDLLYLKIDLQENPSSIYTTEISSKNIMNFNFITLHYDLSSLMAGKVAAVLTRKRFAEKENRKTIKGRDYYDLLWFLKKNIVPNMERISDILEEKITGRKLKNMLDGKIEELGNRYKSDFEADLIPLIENPDIVPVYIDNYIAEYKRDSEYISNI